MADTPVGNGNYEANAGDCMASIAAAHGFLMQTLWELPDNADLKEARKDPYILLPGDLVSIPDIEKQEIACATDSTYNFVLQTDPEKLQLVINDDEGNPVANTPYRLEIDGRLKFVGQTDGSGKIKETIQPTAMKGTLEVGDADNHRKYRLGLGQLNPIDTVSGAQARLLNLGFYLGPVNGRLDLATRTAMVLFQEAMKMTPTGENDGDTQAKLKSAHGC